MWPSSFRREVHARLFVLASAEQDSLKQLPTHFALQGGHAFYKKEPARMVEQIFALVLRYVGFVG